MVLGGFSKMNKKNPPADIIQRRIVLLLDQLADQTDSAGLLLLVIKRNDSGEMDAFNVATVDELEIEHEKITNLFHYIARYVMPTVHKDMRDKYDEIKEICSNLPKEDFWREDDISKL
jgi:hypothetical protein